MRSQWEEKASDKQSQSTRAGEGSLGLMITLGLLLIYRWTEADKQSFRPAIIEITQLASPGC